MSLDLTCLWLSRYIHSRPFTVIICTYSYYTLQHYYKIKGKSDSKTFEKKKERTLMAHHFLTSMSLTTQNLNFNDTEKILLQLQHNIQHCFHIIFSTYSKSKVLVLRRHITIQETTLETVTPS